jgi:hypothetical protein
MAYPRNPNDPYRSDLANDEFRNAASLDSELQPDPELAEGPASGSRVALFAVAIAIVLGAVFYGLNNTSVAPNGSTTAQSVPSNASTAQNAAPPIAPGVRDVTPRSNTEPGTTTGAATTAKPPSATPTGADLNRSGNPPVSNDLQQTK